jgi:hypothetical protein
MKRWILECSTDGSYIDYEEEIQGDVEPGFWECEAIAQDHNCEYWNVTRFTLQAIMS